MEDVAIERVRSFNRFVTQRVGALDDAYLSRDRSLGASRVLWEIGHDGTDVRALRIRLDLDSGYLSRVLRSLEEEGLVTVESAEDDRRVRTVRLTPAGHRERRHLDERSDELAGSLLAPLSDQQRQRLVAAMADVERLLTAGLVEIAVEDPRSPAARFCSSAYVAELDARFPGGFDPSRSLPAAPDDLAPPEGLLLVARLRDEPVGCGALRFHGSEPVELKRMWVAPHARGLGLGRRLLRELERHARDHGVRCIHLETNRALTEAVELYRSAGYDEVAPFSDEPYAHHWFEKQLA